MSELLVNTIKKADGTGSLSVPAESGTVVTTASPSLGRRNLIINGAMQVAQRGTSAVNVTSAGYNTLDRWSIRQSVGYLGSGIDIDISQTEDAPDGFKYSAKVLVNADDTPSTTESLIWQTSVEGQNMTQLSWGTSSGQPVTLSFYVKGGVTGTYSVMVKNNDASKNYIASYTINTADTWEYKTITIPAETSGTWLDDNGVGMYIRFTIAADGTQGRATGSWIGSGADFASGQVNAMVATKAWQITGVQLEVGSVATPFEHRSFGEELALCQRYYQTGDALSGVGYGSGVGVNFIYHFPTIMRSAPTVNQTGVLTVTDAAVANYTQSATSISINSGTRVTESGIMVSATNFSGLTNYRPYFQITNVSGKITFNSEL